MKSQQNLHRGRQEAAQRWEDVEMYWTACGACGTDFPTRATVPPRFCSETCRQRAARQDGLYKVDGCCAICKKVFRTGRYKPARTCSRRCARLLVLMDKSP